MTDHIPFSLKARRLSFRHAIAGIWVLLSTQHNARIHLLATIAVCATAAWLGVSSAEWCILLLAMMAVWIAEASNSALEFLADAVSQDPHPFIKNAKDLAASAVLIASLGSLVIGVLVLGPHVLRVCRPSCSP